MNLALTRELAVYQAKIRLLDSVSDVLTDLADIQVCRKLKSDIDEFISLKSSQGEIPHDPLDHVCGELRNLETALTETDNACTAIFNVIGSLKHSKPLTLTREALCEFQQRIAEWETDPVGRLNALASGFRESDWNLSANDLEPELLTVAQLACPDLTLHKLPRFDLFLFTQQSGTLHEQIWGKYGIQDCLTDLHSRCDSLLRLHEQHQHASDEVLELATGGDFVQARQRVLELDINSVFGDSDYASAFKKCAEWQASLATLTDNFSVVQSELQTFINAPSVKLWGDNPGLQANLGKLSSLEGTLANYEDATAKLPESDFTKRAAVLIANLRHNLSILQNELTRISGFSIGKKAAAILATPYQKSPLSLLKIDFLSIIVLPSEAPESATITEAASCGNIEEVRRHLLRGANLDTRDDKARTALHCAALAGQCDIVTLLLIVGATVDAKEATGDTALIIAATAGHKEVAELLLAKGADVDTKETHGLTALHQAVLYGHKEVAELLLARGADVDAKSSQGSTALHKATIGGHKDVVELLLARGADVDAKRQDGTALHAAAYRGHKEIAELLLAKGIEVDARDSKGVTALHAAAFSGHKDVVELLLAKGIEVDAKDSNGFTALHAAVVSGHKDIVELLLAKGADVDAQTETGITALAFAGKGGHDTIVGLLERYGAKK